MRGLLVSVTVVLALVGCQSDDGGNSNGSSRPRPAQDVALLVERIEAIHPDPWHGVSGQEFKAAAAELEDRIAGLSANEQLVELMRLTALLGERDGHSGIFPLDPTHDRTIHLFPIRLYEFSDGFYVVDAIDRPELIGARVLSIAGAPVEDVARAIRPLVPRDNEHSQRARVAQYMLVAEVLDGLGFTGRTFELDRAEPTLEPVPADIYAAAFEDLAYHPMVPQGLPHRPRPAYLARRLEDRWIKKLPRAVYAAYNVTLGDTTDFAAAIARSGRTRVVLDLRHNPGGDNGTYPPLLETLSRRGLDLTVLIGRTTFSAAGNLIADLERRRDVRFVGEPSGAAPNQWGDPVPIALPATGWTAHVATVYWEKSTPDDPRLAIEPDISVELSSADFFAGRDPVLSTALGRAPR